MIMNRLLYIIIRDKYEYRNKKNRKKTIGEN
jgi:hypothetical protein